MSDKLEGMRLCEEGKECPEDASEELVQGYGIQYQHEQNLTAGSE